MCMLCGEKLGPGRVSREQILRLLALVEHPDALPPEQALRLGGQLLAALGASSPLCCESVAADDEATGGVSVS